MYDTKSRNTVINKIKKLESRGKLTSKDLKLIGFEIKHLHEGTTDDIDSILTLECENCE